MARNASGTHSLPHAAFVDNTTIDTSDVNDTLSDISTELTDSLSRSAKGGMLGVLGLVDGAVGAPGLTFNDEATSGLYRVGAGSLGLAILGVARARLTAAGLWADALTALTATSATLKGAVADGASAVGVILDNTIALANAGAKILSIRSNGSEKAYFDPNGNLFVGGTATTWKRAVASADTSNSDNTTATDIAGLSFACATGTTYLVRGILFVYAAASTTGLQVTVKATGAPTTSTFFSCLGHYVDSTASLTTGGRRSAPEDNPSSWFTTTSVTTAATPQPDEYQCYLVTTSTGTFQLRLSSEVTGSAVTVKAGSYIEYCEVA